MDHQPNKTGALKKDFIAGLIVFLIALPLCLGIAQASHAPLFSGLVAGIVGGIVVGTFSKSHVSVSGPAAGLIAIVIVAIEALGFPVFLCAVMIAGAIQLILGLLKAGSIANYFPGNVIEGMLAGIGLTIIIKELPNAFGYVKDAQGGGLAGAEDGFIWSEIVAAMQEVEPAAAIISVVGITILVLWQLKVFKKLAMIPAGLLVVVIGTLINELFLSVNPVMALAPSHLVNLPVPQNAAAFIAQFSLPQFNGFLSPEVWKTGAIIAVVASIESLLCIEATDQMDPHKRYTSGNAELRAQGIGNMLSGLIGGLPITSVIVRSSANINAGAESKRATIIHGSLLLVCVATIPLLLNHIPKAALSAILLFTGYRLARPQVFRHMWKGGISQFLPFLATVVAVVSLDLLKGVGIGLVISIIFLLRQNIRIPYYYHRSVYRNGELIKLTLAQEVSFLNKASIKETLQKLPANSTVVIDATHTEYIDFDVLDVIRTFCEQTAPDKHINMSMVGFKDVYKVPRAASVHDAEANFKDDQGPVEKSSGDYKKLLKQLSANENGEEDDQTL